MLVFPKMKIRTLLLLSGMSVFVMLIVLIFSINSITNRIFSEYHRIEQLEKVTNYNQKIGALENEFLLYETINSDFFLTQKSPYISEIEKQFWLIEQNLDSTQMGDENNTKLSKYLSILSKQVLQYKENLELLKTQILEKGFVSEGLIGQMRASIHSVEQLAEQSNDLKAIRYMLLLRRHEKDYMLRKELKYQTKFNSTFEEFESYLSGSNLGNNQQFVVELNHYKSLFAKMIEMDQKIGNKTSGHIAQLVQNKNKINHSIDEITKLIRLSSSQNISSSTFLLYALLATLSVLVFLLLYRVSTRIMGSIKSLHGHLTVLGEGNLPNMFLINHEDEIGEMKQSINVLTENLENTKRFAISVGKGNLTEQVNVFGNKGDLGGSLIEMRQQLLKVSEERTLQKEIDQQRHWSNEGIHLISEILRDNADQIHELSKRFLFKLVDYLGANQAYLFLVSDSDPNILKLESAYAYQREKFLKKEIHVGDGLVGTCAIEKKSFFLTDIPQNYIKLTSGLGDSNPNLIYIAPILVDNELLGVLELAAFDVFPSYKQQFTDKVCAQYALALQKYSQFERNKNLLEKLQRQANEFEQREAIFKHTIEHIKGQTISDSISCYAEENEPFAMN